MTAEVAARTAAGQVNAVHGAEGSTFLQIVRANVLTRFNAILGALFVIVLVVGPVQDALFGIVLAVNTAIGLFEEVRAKRLLDRLALLTAPAAHAVRDGVLADIAVESVVADDVLEIRAGDQVVADGVLVEAAGLELDESLLTGESLAVAKATGDEVWSGSVVVAGSGVMEVIRVGEEATAQQIQREGRRASLVRSELVRGNNRLLQLVTWVMVPAGILLGHPRRGTSGHRERASCGQPVRDQDGVRRAAGDLDRAGRPCVPVLPASSDRRQLAHHRHPRLLPGAGARGAARPAGGWLSCS
ncbi:MAG: hypothetical protein M0Z40_00305 [Actinomycetota bacterium]|nr:hypothetical protein [Actinomycetota bacterium]